MNSTIDNTDSALDTVRIGLLSASDRASTGVYVDQGIPALKDWLSRAVRNPIEWCSTLVPDEQTTISAALIDLVDHQACHMVFTTGGTGPSPRDVTPEATLAIADKVLPGFGEQMRQISLRFVPTAILSRQIAVTRGRCLVVNLPGQPKSITEILQGLAFAEPPMHGIFSAIPYCIDLLGGPYIETETSLCTAFRPKSGARQSTA